MGGRAALRARAGLVSRRFLTPAIVVAAIAIGIAAAAVLVSRTDPGPSVEEAALTRGRSITIEPSVLPRVHLFGEPVTAEVTAVYNRGLVKERSLRVATDFSPYTQLGSEQHSVSAEGDLARETWRYRLQCITRQCLPGEPKRQVEFEQGQLQYTRLDPGGVLGPGQTRARSASTIDWPAIEVASRLAPDATQNLTWRAETRNLPAVTYRFDPTVATVGLLGVAGLLGGLAVALLAPFAPKRRDALVHEEVPTDATPLERALLELEQNRNGAVGDRRRTLELLARELHRVGQPGLSGRAQRLAWSKREPDPDEAAQLAGSVRSAVGTPVAEEEE